jgi:hypothetical protein
MNFTTLIQKMKFRRPLSQATAYNRRNVFMFTLPVSEGREGETWELSNKIILFLPPHDFSLSPTLLLYFLPLSLCLQSSYG